jgi:hypothetical protein
VVRRIPWRRKILRPSDCPRIQRAIQLAASMSALGGLRAHFLGARMPSMSRTRQLWDRRPFDKRAETVTSQAITYLRKL